MSVERKGAFPELALARLRELFTKRSWKFEERQEGEDVVILAVFAGDEGPPIKLMIVLPKSAASVSFQVAEIARLPSVESRTAALEYLLDLNSRLAIGAFGIDKGDGEIRFSYGVPVAAFPSTEEALDEIIGRILATCDSLYAPMMRVLWGSEGPSSSENSPVRSKR